MYDGYDVAQEIRNTKVSAAGCLMALASLSFNLDTEEGLKKASSLLSSAAGLLGGGADGGEAAMLEAVCLAQMQECFVFVAERGGKSGATVAALAWGAVERLEMAEKLANNKDWQSMLERKKGLMYAIASCGEAREEDRSGMKHGEKIGRLLEAVRRLKSLPPAIGLEKQHAFYLEQSERLLRVHLKENDTIYFQRVGPPSVGAGKVLARAAIIPEETEDLFATLVSPHARARAQRYLSQYRDTRLNEVTTRAEHSSEVKKKKEMGKKKKKKDQTFCSK